MMEVEVINRNRNRMNKLRRKEKKMKKEMKKINDNDNDNDFYYYVFNDFFSFSRDWEISFQNDEDSGRLDEEGIDGVDFKLIRNKFVFM